MDGMTQTSAAAETKNQPFENEYLDFFYRKPESQWDAPLTQEIFQQLYPEIQEKILLLQKDPGVQELARLTATISPNDVRSIKVVLAPGESQVSHFNRRFIVLTRDLLVHPPRREPETQEIRQARKLGFLRTLCHEIGHALAFRLYQGWLPKVDYKSREFMSSDLGGHWISKETSRTSAWSEGFAEAIATRFAQDKRISVHASRRIIYYGIGKPRSPYRLESVEGFVASTLFDFWGPRGEQEAFEHTLDVLAIKELWNRDGERHKNFTRYLSEHLGQFPQDNLRWELTMQANTLLQGGASRDLPPPLAGILKLARSYSKERVAQAIQSVLREGGDLGSATSAMKRITARTQKLHQEKQPVFQALAIGGDRFQTMPLAELKKAVSRARAVERGLFQQYGYDFAPQVKEAKARRMELEKVYQRRGGR
jgi:hypothetical protein